MRAGGFLFRIAQGRQQHRRENRDDGDDDEKFNQSESGFGGGRSRYLLGSFHKSHTDRNQPTVGNCFSISFIPGDFLPLSAELQALFPAFCRLFGALASSAVFDAKTRHMR
jgi:hypothetical protein